jgi:2-polyprenyl-6-methoxyphenol hydroxylase-like FAD-dependent oxidoreductase
MEDEMKQSDVLIIGAGPTGLVLALWLTKLGVKIRIVDKTAEPGD